MLAAIRSLYSSATIAIRVEGRQGPSVQSETGVKQGCPLSPTLFGLLADGLHRSLQHVALQHGVQLNPQLSVTDLGYADDFALVSGSAEGLQALISAAAAWCAAVGMQPSPDKTVVMEMTSEAQPQHEWQCGGARLQCVAEARYLGMHFESGHKFRPTFSHSLQRLWASHCFLRKRYRGLDCGSSIWLPLQLYKACVEPAGSFGSEVWGVYPRQDMQRLCLETARLQQLRQLSGLGQGTALPIIWRELDLQPFRHAWLLRAAMFWNVLASGQAFHKAMALDAIMLAMQRRACWAAGLVRSLAAVGYCMALSAGVMPVIVARVHHGAYGAALAGAGRQPSFEPNSGRAFVHASEVVCATSGLHGRLATCAGALPGAGPLPEAQSGLPCFAKGCRWLGWRAPFTEALPFVRGGVLR